MQLSGCIYDANSGQLNLGTRLPMPNCCLHIPYPYTHAWTLQLRCCNCLMCRIVTLFHAVRISTYDVQHKARGVFGM